MKLSLFLGLSLFALGALAAADAPVDRIQLDREAKAQFLQLNFYAEGRGMHMSPGLITYFNRLMDNLPPPENRKLILRSWLTKRWGLNFKGQRIVGLFDREDNGLRVGAVGCVMCHSGRAAGQLVVGLGNKNVDVVRMAQDLYAIEMWWKALRPSHKKSPRYVKIEQDALAFADYLRDQEIGNLTQGLVPVSFVAGWFYRVHGEALPTNLRRGQVKVPSLWGYEKKREAGLFSDGFGDAAEVGWGVLVELAAGQKPETVRAYYPQVIEAEKLFHDFLPPKYPFPVNRMLAQKGEALFSRTCANCHGTYARDAAGLPVYEAPKWVPLSVVKTDADRAQLFADPKFKAMVDRSPLRDVVGYHDREPGYIAPRLVGVWARFPYLHNGSVPNVAALLTRPEDRPRAFSLKNSGELERFDERALGLTLPRTKLGRKALLVRARLKQRNVYWTEREGHSSQGHDFYTGLSSADKASIIEYLKTL
jgi:mono/diheme cytochrome c family protein